MRFLIYIGSYIFIIAGYISFTSFGWLTYLPMLIAFVIIPVLELLLPEQEKWNSTQKSLGHDILIYLIVPFHLALVWTFLTRMGDDLSVAEIIGRTLSMGLLFGVYGINVAHELGHRKSNAERFLAQLLLLTTQFMHFFIEHNRGHHKRVGTMEDPATARKNESIYRFWVRVIPTSYASAWNLEKVRLSRISIGVWSLKNDMIKYALLQMGLMVAIGAWFGGFVLMCYVLAAAFGIILLEAINYVEHYGLLREKISSAAYEQVKDVHSWNSNHILGRLILFELTLHSDHHANSLQQYSELVSRKEASQLPTGYPGMIILSLIPTLWFKVMNPRLPKNELDPV